MTKLVLVLLSGSEFKYRQTRNNSKKLISLVGNEKKWNWSLQSKEKSIENLDFAMFSSIQTMNKDHNRKNPKNHWYRNFS